MYETAHNTLILGVGNALRGDDGIGRHIVEELRNDDVSVDLDVVPQLLFELVLRLHHYERVLFVDASVLLPPGKWSIVELRTRDDEDTGLSHHCTPGGLLALTRVLYGQAPPGFLLSIGASDFDHTEQLSDTLIATVPDIVAGIRSWLREHSLQTN